MRIFSEAPSSANARSESNVWARDIKNSKCRLQNSKKWWVPVVKLNYKLHKQIFTMLCYTLCGVHCCVHFSKRTISNDDPRGVFGWTFGEFFIWWKQRSSRRRTVEYVRKRGAKYFGLRLENCGLLKTCLRSMTVTTLSRVWVELQSNLSLSRALCYQNLLLLCVWSIKNSIKKM